MSTVSQGAFSEFLLLSFELLLIAAAAWSTLSFSSDTSISSSFAQNVNQKHLLNFSLIINNFTLLLQQWAYANDKNLITL